MTRDGRRRRIGPAGSGQIMRGLPPISDVYARAGACRKGEDARVVPGKYGQTTAVFH